VSTSLIWEKALRYNWEVTLADGIPAAMTRPGRALIACADWIEDDFSAGRLRKLLQSGDVKLPKEMSIGASRAARILVKAQAAWGRETYRLALGREARTARTRAERDDISDDERERLTKDAAEADELARWIDGLIASVPAPAAPDATGGEDHSGPIDLQALVACGIKFLENVAARSNALDGAAAEALVGSLQELKSLEDFRSPLAEALRFLTERVESAVIARERPRPGRLHVSTLRTAAFSNRRLLFVIGLEEGRVFPGPFEDPILLDDERAKISGGLTIAADRTDEAVYAAISRLAAASPRPDTRICLSYSCRDLREFRETYASWLMLQAYRVVSGQPHASYGDLHRHLGPPKSCVPDRPEDALGPSRWWLSGLNRAGEKGRAAVLKQYPSLASGLRAAEARGSARFTEFDGFVPEAGALLDPARADRVVSPTDLEKAANCPYHYFLERALKVRAIESGDRDRDAWLTPMLKGSLLHEQYAALMRRARDAKRHVSVAADLDWLQAQGRAMLDGLSREMPPPSKEVGDREAREFLSDLELFVREESDADPSREPTGFEVGFGGRGAASDVEAISDKEPVTVDIGGGLSMRLTGRIDRVDVLSDAGPKGDLKVEIIDYKTGRYWKDDWQGVFAGGTRLQHALYGLAVRELFKRRHRNAQVTGAVYRFPTSKGETRSKAIPVPARATVNAVLTDLRTVIAGGLFSHATDKDSCKFCDYDLACGRKTAVAQVAAKLDDPALAPVVRLGAHE
jgi:ATP-dependent helicase/nuclease subunit B